MDALLRIGEGEPLSVGLAAAANGVNGLIGIVATRVNAELDVMMCGSCGVPEELTRLLEDEYLHGATNPVVASLHRAPIDRLVHAGTFTPWDAFTRSPVYEDYCEQTQSHDTGALLAPMGTGVYLGTPGMRRGSEWPEAPVIAKMEHDMRAAFRAYDARLAAVSCDPSGWHGEVRGLILDEDMRFWALDQRQADALIRLGLLRATNRGVAPPMLSARVLNAVARARAGGNARIMMASPEGEPYHLRFSLGPVLRRRRAVTIVTEPLNLARWDAVALHEVYGLTDCEAGVAMHLLQGGTTGSAAAALRLTRETVRTYLRSIYAKTGTGAQSQLVARLSGAEVPSA